MADPSLDARLASLRVELKEWERTFAAENGGRKAGREDIKKNQNIGLDFYMLTLCGFGLLMSGVQAAKYKLYTKLRESTKSDKHDRQTSERAHTLPEKRKLTDNNESLVGYGDDKHPFATPKKACKHSPRSGNITTPLKQNNSASRNADQLHPSQLDPYLSPSHFRNLLTPSQTKHSVSPLPLRAAIGPTPQRDGKALGLFDLLSASGGSTTTAATPSGRKKRAIDVETPSRSNDVQLNNGNRIDAKGLPSTPGAQRSGSGALRTRRYSLTPASSGKKFYLSKFFATPTVGRFATIPEDEGEDADETKNVQKYTPRKGKNSELGTGLETPSFLRRGNLFSFRKASQGAVEGHRKSGLSPIAVRMPPRVVGKGLSALVQGLRDIEEEQLDDDLDALREMEAGETCHSSYKNNALIEDSQHTIQSGPGDREEGTDSPSKSRSAWKKVGQKRTTKLVTMKPIRAKPKQPPTWETIVEEEESGNEQATATTDTAAVSQSITNGLGDKQHSAESSDNAGNESCNNNDGEGLAAEQSILDAFSNSRVRIREVAKMKRLAAEKSSIKSTDETKKASGKPKKVKPEAHANYRALKIRSRRSGGAGAFGGRFGRRM